MLGIRTRTWSPQPARLLNQHITPASWQSQNWIFPPKTIGITETRLCLKKQHWSTCLSERQRWHIPPEVCQATESTSNSTSSTQWVWGLKRPPWSWAEAAAPLLCPSCSTRPSGVGHNENFTGCTGWNGNPRPCIRQYAQEDNSQLNPDLQALKRGHM